MLDGRAFATFAAQRLGRRRAEIRGSSVGGSLLDYCDCEQPSEFVVYIMVSDLQQIIEYPKRDLKAEQDVPKSVLNAYELLKSASFD